MPLPKFIQSKKAVVNIKNKDDKCLRWVMKAAKFSVRQNAESPSKYPKDVDDGFDFTGISFPTHLTEIPKVEAQNNARINVFRYDERTQRGMRGRPSVVSNRLEEENRPVHTPVGRLSVARNQIAPFFHFYCLFPVFGFRWGTGLQLFLFEVFQFVFWNFICNSLKFLQPFGVWVFGYDYRVPEDFYSVLVVERFGWLHLDLELLILACSKEHLASEPIFFRKEQLFGVFEQFCQLPCGIHNLGSTFFVFQSNPWAVCSLSIPYDLPTPTRNISKLFRVSFGEDALH